MEETFEGFQNWVIGDFLKISTIKTKIEDYFLEMFQKKIEESI